MPNKVTDSNTQKNSQKIKTIANIISINLQSQATKLNKPIASLIEPKSIVELASYFDESKINNQGLSKAIEILIETPTKSVEEVLTSGGLLQVQDIGLLEGFVDAVITNNQTQVEQYKSGKTTVIGYLVGQCMKQSKGSGNPKLFNEILIKKITV
jgi:aspartyl-tRNA(Asn)/glutamyl-tRNA(Gln) amidotransferase subunit B